MLKNTAAVAAASIIAFGQLSLPAGAATPFAPPTSGVAFAAHVPVVPGTLPLYRLSTVHMTGSLLDGLMNRTARSANAQFEAHGSVTEVRHQKQLLASFDARSGEAQVVPDFVAAKPGRMASAAAKLSAGSAFASLLPKDATSVVLADPRAVVAAKVDRGQRAQQDLGQTVMTYVTAQRSVGMYPVLGRGSRATVAVANDGSVAGLLRRWKSATQAGTVRAAVSATQIEGAIATQLQPLTSNGERAIVESMHVAYYDGNAAFLQPVVSFEARLLPPAGKKLVGDGEHVIGYVPVARPLEAIPTVSEMMHGRAPSTAGAAGGSLLHPNSASADAAYAVSTGDYIVRNDSSDWLDNAYEFQGGINQGYPFYWAQNFWAVPNVYYAWANSYVNSVNVADTESHGDWWYFTTYQNWGDGVSIGSIGANGNPGYGAASGGSLAHWIIHSCEVIPSVWDTAVADGNSGEAFTPWWGVFQGLHDVVGYRTIMFIDDEMGQPYGNDLYHGYPTISAWFNELNANSSYAWWLGYNSGHLGGRFVPYGRPSAMMAYGNDNDSAYDNAGEGPATGLVNYYQL